MVEHSAFVYSAKPLFIISLILRNGLTILYSTHCSNLINFSFTIKKCYILFTVSDNFRNWKRKLNKQNTNELVYTCIYFNFKFGGMKTNPNESIQLIPLSWKNRLFPTIFRLIGTAIVRVLITQGIHILVFGAVIHLKSLYGKRPKKI